MNKFSNKILVIALLIMAAIFVLTKIFREPKLSANLDVSVFKVDTARITEIRLKPQKESSEVKLQKLEGSWFVTCNGVKAKAASNQVRDLLESIQSLELERMVSRKKEKWTDYEVDDSAAVSLQAFDNDDELINLKLGKESGASGGVTYARIGHYSEVYSLQGYLHDAFDKGFTSWRDQTLLRFQKDQIRKIDFRYGADSSFVLEQKQNKWFAANAVADSAKIESYLNSLATLEHDVFADDYSEKSGPDAIITITNQTGNNIVVKGWRQSFDEWILHSTTNPGTYFRDLGPKISGQIFVGKQQLAGGSLVGNL